MNNYEYIIASLPVLQEGRYDSLPDPSEVISEIREQLSGKDARNLDTLLSGWDSDALCPDFYAKALKSSDAFIREYFRFDLNVRNAKVEYLNKALGRPEGQDTVTLGEEDTEFDELARVQEILSGTDILERERGLDSLIWEKVDDLTVMHVFDLSVILGFIVKLKLCERWAKLDPETGRQFFRSLVDEIRKSKNDNNR